VPDPGSDQNSYRIQGLKKHQISDPGSGRLVPTNEKYGIFIFPCSFGIGTKKSVKILKTDKNKFAIGMKALVKIYPTFSLRKSMNNMSKFGKFESLTE
jgi:hypothetical protein